MSKWEEKRIVDVCSRVVSGGTPLKSKVEYYQNGDIPWLKTGEVKKSYIYETEEKITQEGLSNSSAKLVPKDSIIIAMYGDGNTAGNVAINKIDLTTNQACCNLILNKEVAFHGFIYFYLKGNYNNLVNLKSGGSQQNLNAHTIKSFNIKIPRLSIQKKIAAVLSAYDDLIENNDRRITLLEKMAEEIYREWFVRLRFPGFDRATFHKGIPEGWEMIQLGDIVKDIIDYRGITPGKLNSDWQNEGIAALSALNVKKGKLIRIEDSKCVSEELFEKWMRKKLDRLDILLTSEAPLGEVYILMKKEKYVLSQRLFAIRANPKKIQPIYLYYYLLCEVGQYELTSKATGSTVGGIRQALLRKVEILKPTNLFQEKFASIAEPILEDIYKLWNKNNLLKQTRDRLLTRLISGKLSVEDLDIQFPTSMTTDA